MGRVDWDEAELWYVSDSRMSYSMLAAYYKVSKPTIQAHGTKHKWKNKREDFKKKRMNNLLKKFDTDIDKINQEHLQQYRVLNSIIYKSTFEIGLNKDYDIFKKANDVAQLTKALVKVIMQERILLGLPVDRKKAVVNPDYIDPWRLDPVEHATDEEVRLANERFKRHQQRISELRPSRKDSR